MNKAKWILKLYGDGSIDVEYGSFGNVEILVMIDEVI